MFQKHAKDDATGVLYIPGCAFGLLAPMHTLRTYIHAAWVSLYLFNTLAIPTATNRDR